MDASNAESFLADHHGLKPPPFGQLRVEAEGTVGRLTLDRPDALNPLGSEMLGEIIGAATWFDARDAVRVVVVTGAGRAFSAGADVAAFVGAPDAAMSPRAAADLGRRMADAVEGMRAITIAAVHGHCIGGGVVLAAACDLRVAADDANFAIPEMDLGIPLAWGGIPRLVREIGPAATKDLVLTCRRFTAAEAASLGLVNRVVEPSALHATIDDLAATVAAKSPLTLEATKRHVDTVSREMADPSRSWSDADALVAALGDEGSRQVAHENLRSLGRG